MLSSRRSWPGNCPGLNGECGHCFSAEEGSWGHFLVFGAAGINAAVATIGHFEGAEVFVIAIAKGILVFKIVAHAAFPATGHLDPGVTNSRLFLISQFDLQLDGFARQLIEGVRGKRTTSGDIALSIGVLDRKSTRLNSSHITRSRMPSSA